MRPWLLLPVLTACLACGSSKLSRREAEGDIRKDYPVQVLLRVPETAKAAKGSAELAKLAALQEQLTRTGWFTVERSVQGDSEQFSFHRSAAAPGSVQATGGGFQVPAAEAEFVRATRLETSRENDRSTATVTYQVRLVRPTPAFAAFQALFPAAHAGASKDRHASYRREGRSWVLQGTDESFKKVR